MSDQFYCRVCGKYGWRSTTVDGVVVRGDKVLLLKRAIEPDRGKWCLPGGFVMLDETCEQAVVREVKEEIGLDTKIVKLIGVFSDPNRDIRHCLAVAYFLKVQGGKAEMNRESNKMQWFVLDKLPKMGFDHRRMVDQAVNEN